MPNWTKPQRDTIESRDENILVSAAAGSGKTAVLVERIKQLILKDHVDIDKFLITTFTNAAAAEMKQKIEETIIKEIDEGADEEEMAFLMRQLRLLPSASISTFHSFSMNLIKEYFYLIDIEPGFAIGDEVQVKLLCNAAVDKVFDKRFEEDFEAFGKFLSKYSKYKTDKALKESIINTLKTLKSIPHYMDWAEARIEIMKEEHPLKTLGIESEILREVESAFSNAYEAYDEIVAILDSANLLKLRDKFAENRDYIEEVIEARSLKAAYDFFKNIKFAQLRKTKGDNEEDFNSVKYDVQIIRDKAKKPLDTLKKAYFNYSEEEYEDDIRACYEDTLYFFELLKDTEESLRVLKKEKGIVDFDDIMHYAIHILEKEEVSKEIRNKYEYIFVDEYQDSNALQEEIIGGIARENNLFMVGDVKQSIYKFRLAEPEIFMRRAAEYKDEEDKNSRVINLNHNFRSKSSVTDAVNIVFREIMEGYGPEEELNCTIEDPGHPTVLHILDRDAMGVSSMEQGEAEAALVAKIINDHLGSKYYDPKENITREITLKDIAVLSRSKRPVAEIEHYLNNEGIPAYGETSEGYFETVEIQAFINVLKIIDNLHQDVPLISAMRTIMFDFSVKEMALIRAAHKIGDFYGALMHYKDNGEDKLIKNKIEKMLIRIKYWKELARTVPLEELIRVVLYETGYYDYCSGLPAGGQRTANLRLIIEKASSFQERNFTGLYGFLKYIELMKDSKISEAEAKVASDGADVVRVMTVHKSKGLEFPIVILVGAGKQINTRQPSSISIHKDYGIGLNRVNKEEKWHRKTLLQKAISSTMDRESREEEVRILYVAMTRAKDRLEIVGTVNGTDKLTYEPENTSYLNMIYPVFRNHSEIEVKIYENISDIGLEERARSSSFFKLLELAQDRGTSEEMREKLSYNYPHKLSQVKTKYSVSELNKGHRDLPIYMDDLLNKLEKASSKELTPAEEGTVMHLIMEKMDFSKALYGGAGYVKDFSDELLRRGMITVEARRSIREENIAKFFRYDVGKRAAEAFAKGKLFREKEFICMKEIDGVETVVQGIVDCYFIEDDHIVLIDYKNSYMSPGRSIADIKDTYGAQIRLYSEALEGATGLKVKDAYLYLFNDAFHQI